MYWPSQIDRTLFICLFALQRTVLGIQRAAQIHLRPSAALGQSWPRLCLNMGSIALGEMMIDSIAGWWFQSCIIVFPYIGNYNPNWLWLIFFRGVETTNQPLELAVFNPVADHRICDIDSLFRTFPDCDCMPWCHGQNGQLSESLHFTQEDSLQTSKSRGSSSFSYAKTAIIKWGHFPSRPSGDRCAKALMPGYDVQEVSKEVSRGQQWASGPVGQWASGPVGQWASGPDSCYPIPWGLVYFGAVRTDRDLWTVCWFMFFFFFWFGFA